MAGVGCGCGVSLDHLAALGQHDRQQEKVQVGCETGVARLHATTAPRLRGNNSSLGHPVVHHIHNGISLPAG
jgi:hypothetical protein